MKKTFVFFLLLMILSSCHVGRFIFRNTANISDHKIFPSTPIEASHSPFRFHLGDPEIIKELKVKTKDKEYSLDNYLKEQTKTTAFLVIHNDSILFEKYYRGYDQNDISNIFSASKSVTSLLVGLAIEDGYVDNVQDPITKYLPELKEGDPAFQQLTIENLLNMRSGLNFKEAYGSPFAHVARLYYGKNQYKQIQNLKFEVPPGTVHKYQSVSTSLLGILVEKTTGKALGTYLEEKIWQPIGMENDATWSLDDKKDPTTKAFCCLNTTARDLAKIGRLYLKNGNWEGKQIISEEWVKNATTPNLDNDFYQYQWYSYSGIGYNQGEEMVYQDSLSAVTGAEKYKLPYFYVDRKTQDKDIWHIHYATREFYALGILGQFIYVHPDKDLIIIRLGEKNDDNYYRIFRKIAALF